MSDELDDFTAELNSGTDNTPQQPPAGGPPGRGPPGGPPGRGGPGGPPPNLTPQQMAQMKAAKEMKEKMDARPLTLEKLKGKVDLKWFGHAGFKIQFLDAKEIHRNIYIDVWIDNKDCPEEEKKECPNDADLILVTHGQLDHSMHAPFLCMAGKREERKIVCSSEVGTYYELFRKIPPQFIAKMQKGGTKDFGFCKVTMVAADHPSTCVGPQGVQITGGSACGFVITIPDHNIAIYHAGDTNVFSDMKLIDELYKPNIALLPIGDCLGMGPREAAYAVKNFLPTPETIIPMHFNSFPVLTGTPEEFEHQCKFMGVIGKKIVHPKEYFGNKPLVE